MSWTPRLRFIDLLCVSPYIGVYLSCLLVFWVGWSPVAVGVALALYLFRMFVITAFYHRYFSHRAFSASRPMQLVMAILGTSCVQQGPLWWAAHHRIHHRVSDAPEDIHSPAQYGFFWSQLGWILSRSSARSQWEVVPDLARFPELRFLDRFHGLVPVGLAVSLYWLGATLEAQKPALGTSAMQMFIWGFSISTVLMHHASFTINSLSHRFGSRRYDTNDDSRNNLWLALLTFGEGWHNNHHRYPSACRQGHRWWEIDVTYYVLVLLSRLRIVSKLRPVPLDRGGASTAAPPAPTR